MSREAKRIIELLFVFVFSIVFLKEEGNRREIAVCARERQRERERGGGGVEIGVCVWEI